MAAFDFPASPTNGQLYSANGVTYRWNGFAWVVATSGGGVTDGDRGDVTVSGGGEIWMFDSAVVTPAAKTVLDDSSTGTMLTTLGAAPVSHTHTTAQVTGLDTALASKASTTHTHPQSDITNLTTDLAGKAPTSHTHTTAQVTGLDTALAGKAPTVHTHPQSDITNLTTDLAGKAPTSHTHTTAQVTGLDTALAGKEPSIATGNASYFWAGDKTWKAVSGGGGAGDVVGPSTATDNALVRFDATTGKLVQDSTLTVEDNGTFTLKSGASTILSYTTVGTSSSGGMVLTALPPHGQTISITPRSDIDGSSHIGGTITFDSAVTLPAANPTADTHAAHKKYVDDKVAAGGGGGGLDQATADTRYINVTGDAMTGVLQVTPGTALAPSIHFGTVGVGLWGSSTNVGISAGGNNRLSVSATSVYCGVPLSIQDGAVNATSINFGSANTGVFGNSSAFNISIGGTQRLGISATAVTAGAPMGVPSGSVTAPGLNFGNTGSGFYGSIATIAATSGGVRKLLIAAADITADVPIVLPADPTLALQAATKQYADTKEPALPAGGTTSNFLRGDKTWAVPAGGGGGIPEAPTDGQVYSRRGSDASWQIAAGGGGGAASSVTFTPAGTLAATNVQAAIEEVDAEFAKLAAANAFTGANTFNSAKQTFAYQSATTAGINIVQRSSDPSSRANGDIWLRDSQLKWQAQSSIRIAAQLSGNTFTGSNYFSASTTSEPSIRLLGGVTPTTPTNGDIWHETATNDMFARVGGVTKSLTAAVLPAGVMMPYAGGTAPSGYLLCYGQAVSRTTYAALFTAIATAWGAGDGTTTFNIPDLRGRGVAGMDNMGGTAANRLTNSGVGNSGIDGITLGAVGGVDRLGITEAQMPSHAHTASDSGHGHTVYDPTHYHSIAGLGYTRSAAGYALHTSGTGYTERVVLFPGTTTTSTATSDWKATATSLYTGYAVITVAAAGGSEAHPIVQPTAIVNYIISTGGV